MSMPPAQTKRIDNPGLTARHRAPEPAKPPALPPADEPEGELDEVITTKPVADLAPAPPRDPSSVVFSKTYMAFGEPVKQVKFRRPVTRDIRKFGNPLKVKPDENGEADIELKWDVVANYVSALSDPPLPPTTVDELDYFDLDACAAVIAPFFVRLGPPKISTQS